MADQLIKVITKDEAFRAFAVDGTTLVQEAAEAHETSRLASVVLGRALLATEILAQAALKGEERLNVKMSGRGPIGQIVTEADTHGAVRGYVSNPNIEPIVNDDNQLNVAGAVGNNGSFQVTKFAPYSNPYIGQSIMVSGEIGDDFTYYLTHSEQIPSVVGVGVTMNPDDTVKAAGGFLIQALPGATDEQLVELNNKLQKMPALSTLLGNKKGPLAILDAVLGDKNYHELQAMTIGLAAEPDKEAYAKQLATLPSSEIQAMIDEDGGAEVRGKFSGKKHQFTAHELDIILQGVLKREAEEDKQADDSSDEK
ncbi:Hsp33 family molecular chaperone HslO [Fructobacillus sp. M1-13]|uniref:33 kDa chaperonin n=1 Tax=Fructobacillus papyriferae TaxID=2713171 RepID=A0ABS5QR00_9LACO|nr:Hsp33 family molecular chaperone HslO [Fructobacillus papyriferae]MBS9335601.1 Hsp33 family molecular chaperone HslO [Fructobacillus papyriferae]MCD2159310.1 Hsp33 family molecular chaperone HslO [Fructobacillus papyriferae]